MPVPAGGEALYCKLRNTGGYPHRDRASAVFRAEGTPENVKDAKVSARA